MWTLYTVRTHLVVRSINITMRNEALETHVVRYVNLLAAPRTQGDRIFKDEDGGYWRASSIQTPDTCTGPEGNILKKVSSFDGNERYSLADPDYLGTKETLDLWFDHVPKGKKGLVIASRQTLLSTYILYQALAYMGSDIGKWFAKLRVENDLPHKSDLSGMLGKIDVLMQDSTGHWQRVGYAGEHGPLATDVFLVHLPSKSKKGPLHVRLRMTKGDWRIDYLALAGLQGKIKPIRITPSLVLKGGVADQHAYTALTDSAKTLITLPGDSYTLRYQLPDSASHYELFLVSHGYYLEWMRKEWAKEQNHQKLVQLEQQVDQYEKAGKDYETVKSQLIDILKRGHILFPHLHPHWVDANYDRYKNEWSISNYRYYRFHNLPDPLKKTLFETSIQILTEVQDAAGIHHPIEGYRAGGWSIMPFSDFRPYFEQHKIFYDLSAISKSVSHTTAQDYDYRSVSGDTWYTFDEKITSPVENAPFLEHPVSTISLSSYRALADRLWRKVNWKLGYRSIGNGRGAEGKPVDSSTENTTDRVHLGIENLSQATYPVYKQFIKQHSYIHFLSHPKMVSKVNLFYWNRLLKWIHKNYSVDYNYKIPEFEQSRQRSYHNQAQ